MLTGIIYCIWIDHIKIRKTIESVHFLRDRSSANAEGNAEIMAIGKSCNLLTRRKTFRL